MKRIINKWLLLILPFAFLFTFAYAPQTEAAMTLEDWCNAGNGDWNDPTKTCTVLGSVSAWGTLYIGVGETLYIHHFGGTITNNAYIENYGTITNSGFINNHGTIFNDCEATFINDGDLIGFPIEQEYCLQDWCESESNCTWDDITSTCTVNGSASITVMLEIRISETLRILVTGTINNTGYIRNHGTIDNYATITNSNVIDNHGTIDNHVTIDNSVTISNSGVITNSGTIDNTGIIDNKVDSTINNTGTIFNDCEATFINDGDLIGNQIEQPYCLQDWCNAGNGTWNDHTSTCTVRDSVSAMGTLYVGVGQSLYNFGTITNTSDITNYGIIDNYGRINNTGTIDNLGYIRIHNFSIIDNDGTIDNLGDISNSGSIYNDGTINNPGDIYNYSFISNYSIIDNDGTIDSVGDISNSGTIDNTGIIYMGSASFINNNPDGTINNTGYIRNFSIIDNFGTIFNNCGATFFKAENVAPNPIVQEGPCGWVEAIDLGTLGGDYSRATSINESGFIVGFSNTGLEDQYHAFIITPLDTDGFGGPDTWYRDILPLNDPDGVNDLMIDLGTFEGGYTTAYDINNDGVIAGYSYNLLNESFAFLISPLDTDLDGTPDQWYKDDDSNGENDLMTPLSTLGGNFSTALAINNHGQIAGATQILAGDFHSCIWNQDTVPIDLGSGGAGAINDSGETVGTHANGISLVEPQDTDSNGIADIFFQDFDLNGTNDLWTDLGAYEDMVTRYNDINNLTHIVGYAYYPSPGGPISDMRAILWKPGTGFQEIGTLGADISFASSINDLGQVIGMSTTWGPGHAYIWTEEGGMVDLGTIGGLTSIASDVNETGEKVVGRGRTDTTETGETHAVLWRIFPDTSVGIQSQVTPHPNVQLTFGQISAPGLTTVTESQDNPGFSLGVGHQAISPFYEVATTAIFTNNVTVCLSLTTDIDENTVSLLHCKDETCEDVTDTRSRVGDTITICGSVSSFSWLVLAILDSCPDDPNKTEPGVCGCGVADTDSDGDGTADCIDNCPSDPNKVNAGVCGCGIPENGSDGDGVIDCNGICSVVDQQQNTWTLAGFAHIGQQECYGTQEVQSFKPSYDNVTGVELRLNQGPGLTFNIGLFDALPNTGATPLAEGIITTQTSGTAQYVTANWGEVPVTPGQTYYFGYCWVGGSQNAVSGASGNPYPNGLLYGLGGNLDFGGDYDLTFKTFSDRCPDNCPSDRNPDQSDIDGDSVGDVCDNCPSIYNPGQLEIDCNTAGSGGASIGSEGGNVTTDDTSIVIPPEALETETSISITETGEAYELVTDDGVECTALYGVTVGPEGQTFNTPITISFSWNDSDGDGVVDGTNIEEATLLITKDNVAITDFCENEPLEICNMLNNTFSIEVTTLSVFTLSVLKVSPIVGDITSLDDPLNVPHTVPAQINVRASFIDPGFVVMHTADWEWGDGTTSDGVVNETGGSGTVEGSHQYAIPGVYTVTLTVSDDNNETGISVYQYIVVYDPEGSFVTGGGWIHSPEGAYIPSPSLAGRANFGFVSKYKKGATVPTGETEFKFKVANLNFHSDTYDWLVVAGHQAKFKGTGTINGAGNYGFMLSAVDEKLTPSTDIDLFRIKIWDKDDGDATVYDNEFSIGEDIEPTTAIGGGSIVIHKGG